MSYNGPGPDPNYGAATNGLLYSGPQYANTTTPLWCPYGDCGGMTGGIGPNILVSTIGVNAVGDIFLGATGTASNITSAPIQFGRTSDAIPVPSSEAISMVTNTVQSYLGPTYVPPIDVECITVTNNGRTSHDALAVGDLHVYGNNDSIPGNDIQLGSFVQYENTTDLQLNSSGFHLSSLWVSSINGGAGGGGGGTIPPDLSLSTLTINAAGNIKLQGQAPLWFPSGSLTDTSLSAFPNNQSITPPFVNWRSANNPTFLEGVIGDPEQYYGNVMTGGLGIYDTKGFPLPTPAVSASIVGQIVNNEIYGGININSTRTETQNLIVSSINGFEYPGTTTNYPPDAVFSTITTNPLSGASVINDLNVSTINGLPYTGGGIAGPNLLVSTMVVNDGFGVSTIAPNVRWVPDSITMTGRSMNAGGAISPQNVSSFYGAPIQFQYVEAIITNPNNTTVALKVNTDGTNLVDANFNYKTFGIYKFDNLVAQGSPNQNILTAFPLNVANLYVSGVYPIPGQYPAITNTYGTITCDASPSGGTHKQLHLAHTEEIFIDAPSVRIPNLNTTTLRVSTLYVSSIVDYVIVTSTLNTSTITSASIVSDTVSSIINQNSLLTTSTINFNASAGGVSLGGIDLGLGGYLGGLTGQLVSGALTTTIAGAALGTGIAGLVLPRTYPSGAGSPPGGNISSFSLVNGTTQLQFSTLGANTSTFTRYTSSISGSDPTLVPNPEFFISSVITPGTPCIRSFSDPINPANPSTFTSTLQAFGQWVPIPALPVTPVSNIIASTITLGQVGGSAALATLGYATVNGVTIGSNAGAILSQTIQTGNIVTGGSMDAAGNIVGTTLSLNGAGTINTRGSASINGVLIGTSGKNVTASTISGLSVTGNTVNASVSMSAPLASFSTLGVSTLTATNLTTTGTLTIPSLNTSNITVTGYISTIGLINTSGNINQTGAVSEIRQNGIIGLAILQSGVLSLTPNIGSSVTINNSGVTQTSQLTVTNDATMSTITTKAINGGIVSTYPPAYNSCAAVQRIAPFSVGGTSYYVNVPINRPCLVHINATASSTDGTNTGAAPVQGSWIVSVVWYQTTFALGLHGGVGIIYANGITLYGGNQAIPGSGLNFNIVNTSISLNQLDVSWFISSSSP